MTDRELLELAAKACGYTIRENGNDINGETWYWCEQIADCWNPLNDDGDSARLESVMRFDVTWYERGVLVGPRKCSAQTGSAHFRCYSDHADDKQAARRYAGVCAAAEIGKAM